MLCLSCALVGCANIKDDSTRTKTEGTLLGAGLGAGLGALVGGLTGGGRGALVGASIGAAAGGLGGYALGTHVANKKAEYASQEDWLDDCIVHAEQFNAEVHNYNAKLGHDIQVLDRQSKALLAQYQRRQIDRKQLRAEYNRVQKSYTDSKKVLSQLEYERTQQQQVARQARRSGDTRRAQKLDAEIAKLDRQIKKTREYNNQLANISVRMAV